MVRDSASNVVATKSTTLKIIDKPSSPSPQKNILLVGASTEANGRIAAEVRRRLTTNEGTAISTTSISNRSYLANPQGDNISNIGFIGRLNPHDSNASNPDIQQEAVPGRKIKDLVIAGADIWMFHYTPNSGYSFVAGSTYTQGGLTFTVIGSDTNAGDLECSLTSGSGQPLESGTLTLSGAGGTASLQYTSVELLNSNPFWYNGGIDFAHYASTYCDNASIDIMPIQLGTNDIFNSESINTIIGYFKDFIDAYITYCTTNSINGKVILMTSLMPDCKGGMA